MAKHKNKHDNNNKAHQNNLKKNGQISLINVKKCDVKTIISTISSTPTNNKKDNNNNDNNSNSNSKNMSKLSLLQQKFAKKLDGARFRIINEELYTRY